MIILLLVILILMNGVGYFNPIAGAPTGYRYGNGVLGILCLILLVLDVLHMIPANF